MNNMSNNNIIPVNILVPSKTKKRKKHRHKWDIAQESCFACGASSEFCTVDGCTAERLTDGKEVIVEDDPYF